jgi:hypothetical protein
MSGQGSTNTEAMTMVDGSFDADKYLKLLGESLVDTVEEQVPAGSLLEVLDKLPACCEHVVWSLSKSTPNAVNLLCQEIRRKVMLAFTVHPDRERHLLTESMRGLLRDLEAMSNNAPENN